MAQLCPVRVAAEIVRSGFEYPNLLQEPGAIFYPPIYYKTYLRIFSPEIVDGWTLTDGSVDIVRHLYPSAAEGDQSLDLNGVNAGTLSRDFETIPGVVYLLSFKYSGNPIGGFSNQIALRVNDVIVDTLGWDPLVEGNNYEINMRFKCAEYAITATSERTTISFQSSNPDALGFASGPELDDIRFAPADDPERISPPTVGGLIWLDENANGVRDPSESVLPGVTVHLVTPGETRTALSDGLGRFSFDNPGPRAAFRITTEPPPLAVPTYDPDGLETPNSMGGGGVDDCAIEFGYLMPRIEYVSRDPESGEIRTESNLLLESLPFPTCSLEVKRKSLVSLGTPEAPRYGLSVDLLVKVTDTIGELPEFTKLGLDTLRFVVGGRVIHSLTNLSIQARPVTGNTFWRARDSSLELPVSLVVDRIRPGPVTLMVRTDGNQHGRRAQAAVTFTVFREAVEQVDALGNLVRLPGILPILDPETVPGPAGEDQGLRLYAIRLLVPQASAAEAVNRSKVRWQLNGTDLRLVTGSEPDPGYTAPGMTAFYLRTGVGTAPDRFLFGERFEPRFCPRGVYASGQVEISVVRGGTITSVDRRPILKEDRGPVDPGGIGIAAATIAGDSLDLAGSAAAATPVTAAAAAAAVTVAAPAPPRYTLADVLTSYYLLYQEPGLEVLDWFLTGTEGVNVDVPPVQLADLIWVGPRATLQLGNVKGPLDWDGWKLNFVRAKATAANPNPPLRGVLSIERDYPNAAKAAVALSDALQSLKGAATPTEFNLDLATLDRLMEQVVSENTDGTEILELADYWRNYTLASVREPMAALEQALEFGVSLNPIAGGVIGLSYAYDEFRAGNDLKAGLQAALSVLPVVGMAGRGGLKLAALEISVFGADLAVPALSPATAQTDATTVVNGFVSAAAPATASRYLRAKVFLQGPAKRVYIPIARQFHHDLRAGLSAVEARVKMMQSLRNQLSLPPGEGVSLLQLEQMVNAGLIPTFAKSKSRRFTGNLFGWIDKATTEVHHWLPLQHELKFLANGIDPNEIVFLDPLYKTAHRPMHNAERFLAGGPLNASWVDFFRVAGKYPGPTRIIERFQELITATQVNPIEIVDIDNIVQCWIFRFYAARVPCP